MDEPVQANAGNTAPPTKKVSSRETIREKRAARLNEYEEAVLKSKSPLKAILGSANSDLIKMQHALGDAISHAVSSNKISTPEGVNRLLPAFDTHLKYSRQVDRMTQVSIRLEESQGK